MADKKYSIDADFNLFPTDASKKGMESLIRQGRDLEDISKRIAKNFSNIGTNSFNHNMSSGAQGTADINRTLGSLDNTINRVEQELQRITRGSQVSTNSALIQKIDSLQSTLKSLNQVQSRVSSQSGYNPVTRQVDFTHTDAYRQLVGLASGTHSGYRSSYSWDAAEEARRRHQRMTSSYRDQVQGIASQARRVHRVATNENSRIANAFGGTMSYERRSELERILGNDSVDTLAAKSRLSTTRSSFSAREDILKESISQNQGRIRNLLGKESLSPQDQAQVRTAQQKVNADRDELVALHKSIDSLSKWSSMLDNTDTTLKSANDSLSSGVSNGDIKIGPQRGSFGSFLQQRWASLSMAAGSQITSAIGGYNQSGLSIRQQMENSTNPITLASNYKAPYRVGEADNYFNDKLGNMGRKNGTNYSVAQMAQFANDFATSTGNVKNGQVLGGANALSQFTRFGNVQSSTTQQLMQTLGASGAAPNAAAVTQLTHSIEGGIKNANLGGRADEQVQALNQILGTLSGQSISSREVSGISAAQNILGTGSKALQGANGAAAISALTQGIQNGYNNPFLANAFANGNPAYAGAEGQARLYGAMQNPWKNPGQVASMVNNLRTGSFQGSTNQTAAYLSQQMGITYEGAQKIAKDAKSGNLSSSEIQKAVDKNNSSGKSSSNHVRRNYNAQGNSTIDLKIAIDDNGKIAVNEGNDAARRVGNSANNSVSPWVSGVGGLVTGIAGSIAGNIGFPFLTSMFKDSAAGKSMLGKLGQLPTKVGTGVSSLVDKFTGSASTVANGVNDLNTVKDVSFLSKGARFAKGAGAVGIGLSLLSGSANSTNALGARKGNTFGGKVSSAIGSTLGGTGNGVLSKDSFGNKLMDIGGSTLSGAATGAAFGGIPGALIGGGVGLVGGLIGGNNITRGINSAFTSVGEAFGGTKVDAATIDSKNKRKETKAEKRIREQKDLLDQYNRMLDKAERVIADARSVSGKSGSSTSSSSSDAGGFNAGSGSASDKMKRLATQIGKKAGISPDLVLAQIGVETGSLNGTASSLGRSENNFSGMKYVAGTYGETRGSASPEGDNYAKFSTPEAWAAAYSKTLENDNVAGSKTAAQFANALKKANYYGASESSYAASLQGYLNKEANGSGHALGGIFSREHVARISEGGTPEAIIPLGNTQRGKSQALLRQSANLLGMSLGRSARASGGSSNIAISPNYSVTINGADGQSEQQMKEFAKRTTEEITKNLNNIQGNMSNFFSYNTVNS